MKTLIAHKNLHRALCLAAIALSAVALAVSLLTASPTKGDAAESVRTPNPGASASAVEGFAAPHLKVRLRLHGRKVSGEVAFAAGDTGTVRIGVRCVGEDAVFFHVFGRNTAHGTARVRGTLPAGCRRPAVHAEIAPTAEFRVQREVVARFPTVN